jgi:hypothetical protein
MNGLGHDDGSPFCFCCNIIGIKDLWETTRIGEWRRNFNMFGSRALSTPFGADWHPFATANVVRGDWVILRNQVKYSPWVKMGEEGKASQESLHEHNDARKLFVLDMLSGLLTCWSCPVRVRGKDAGAR